jgi:hypothetical protein
MTTPTAPSVRTGGFVPQANTTWGFRECCGMHSSTSATTCHFPSTTIVPFRPNPIQTHGLNVCEVRVEIPFDPMAPWMGAVVGNELDDAIEKMAHAALTSLRECSLTATTDMSISLFPIHDQEDPVWQQCLKAVSDLESPHFNAGWAEMAKYVRYLFNLQHNTGRIVIQQCMRLIAYEEQATITLCEMEMMRHENAILHRGIVQSSDKDLELQVTYHRLSEVKHGWNYNRQ